MRFIHCLQCLLACLFLSSCDSADDVMKKQMRKYLQSEVFSGEKISIISIQMMDDKFIQADPWMQAQVQRIVDSRNKLEENLDSIRFEESLNPEMGKELLAETRKDLLELDSLLEKWDGAAIEHARLRALAIGANIASLATLPDHGDDYAINSIANTLNEADLLIVEINAVKAHYSGLFINDLVDYLKYKRYESTDLVPYQVGFSVNEKPESFVVLSYNKKDRKVLDHRLLE